MSTHKHRILLCISVSLNISEICAMDPAAWPFRPTPQRALDVPAHVPDGVSVAECPDWVRCSTPRAGEERRRETPLERALHESLSAAPAAAEPPKVCFYLSQAVLARDRDAYLRNPDVTCLVVAGRTITSVDPRIFSLTHLKKLDLAFNGIRKLPPLKPILDLLTLYSRLLRDFALEELCVDNTQISTIPAWFGLLPRLRKISFNKTQVRDLPKITDDEMAAVKTVWPDAEPTHYPALEELQASFTPLAEHWFEDHAEYAHHQREHPLGPPHPFAPMKRLGDQVRRLELFVDHKDPAHE